MEIVLSTQALLGAGLVFLLRVTDMSLDTLRVLVVVRGRKGIAWVLGFFQAAVFVLAIGIVLKDIRDPVYIIAYAAGFATGNVIGMWLEERLAIGHTHLSIISSNRGSAVAEGLRAAGYAVTEIPGRGKDGMVTILNCSVLRKNADKVRKIINEVDPDAFITAEDVRPVRRGFWRA